MPTVTDGLTAPGPPPAKNMIWIPGGEFLMGSSEFYPEERPVHRVAVDGTGWTSIRSPMPSCVVS
jgi:formylglycine-generating enzyme